MTLDEAIKHAEEVAEVNAKQYKNCPMIYDVDGYEHRTASECAEEHRHIVEWLKDYKRLKEQEPCEDAISRDELLKAIDTWDKFGCDADTKLVPYQDHYIPYIHYDDVVKCIKGMSSVNPQPKTGHWIEEFNDLEGEVRFTCSSCGKYQLFGTDYCPNCGAKMTESEVEK